MYSELFQLDKLPFEEYDIQKYPCQRCSLPVEYLGEMTGICCICKKNNHKMMFRGQAQFEQDISASKVDKLAVTVSGGKDSIYAWMKSVQTFGNEAVIGVSYIKPGISHPIAISNIIQASNILKSKVIFIVDTDCKDRLIRMLRILLHNPNASMVRPLLCAGCRTGITLKIYDRCKKMGINKVLSAASYLELAPFKNELLVSDGIRSLEEGIRSELNKYSTELGNSDMSLIREEFGLEYKRNISNGYPTLFEGIKIYDFDWYFENEPYKFEKYISDKLKWKRTEKSWHFDCQIEYIKDMFYYGLLGYTEADFKLSAMVRSNKIGRLEAIGQIRYYNSQIRRSKSIIKEFLKSISCGDEIINGIDMFFKQYIDTV